ncbi:MAG TPA: glutathione S-transferase [Gammaproteobacteria bacterium]
MTTASPAIRVYRHPLSGHAHRVELFLSLLGLPYEPVDVDLRAGEHKTPEFLARNPFGQVPVLEDGDVTLADSNAILVYLASRYDSSGRWYPRDPLTAGRIQQWLSVAAGQLAYGPATARRIKLLGAPLDYEQARATSTELFTLLDRHLAARPFLVGDAPTIADLAMYSYTAVAPEGGIALDAYENIRAWLARVEGLQGFLPMTRAG